MSPRNEFARHVRRSRFDAETATVTHSVAAHIRALILSGQLTAGSRVLRDQLAADLGVSVTPVREALVALENEGLVEIEPRRGAFVCELSPESVRDHFALLGFVLGQASRRVIELDNDEHISGIAELGARIQREDGPVALYDLARSLHWAIHRYGGSRKLRLMAKTLGPLFPEAFFETSLAAVSGLKRGSAEICRAVVEREPDSAAAACSEYMQGQGRAVLAELTARGVITPE